MPLRDEIRRTDSKEGAVTLSGTGFGKVRLASTGRSIKQDTGPWLSRALEQLRELDRQNDSFLEGLFSTLQPSNIGPLDIWLLGEDSTGESILQFLVLILFFAISLLFLFGRGGSASLIVFWLLWSNLMLRCC